MCGVAGASLELRPLRKWQDSQLACNRDPTGGLNPASSKALPRCKASDSFPLLGCIGPCFEGEIYMRDRLAACVLAFALCLFPASSAHAADDQAQTVSTPNGLTNLTVGVPLRAAFNGSEEISFPMNVGWVLYDQAERCAILRANFYPLNTNETLPWVSGDSIAKAFCRSGDGRDGTRQFQVRMIPWMFKDAGDSITLEAWMETDAGKFTFPAMTIAVDRNVTSIISATYSRQTVKMVAKAQTSRGLVPAEGVSEVRYQLPRSKSWKTVPQDFAASELKRDGSESAQVPRALPKGTNIEVSVRNCGWCSNATKIFKVK